MTTPEPAAEGFQPRPSDAEFGPDHAQSSEDIVRERLTQAGVGTPKVNQKNPPKASTPKSGRSVFTTLGQNKKPRSGIRKLTAEDRDKIASLYTFGAMGLMPFKANAAQAMALSADKCADAWMELAEQNDGVRRVLLMLVEGGVWGKVFAAHTPILLALLPEKAMPQMFKGVDLNAFFDDQEEEGK